MMRSLYSGVSGLKTHQTKMDVIGNNIANVNTVAFKSSSTTFSDLMYQTVANSSGATNTRGGVNARQIGLGVTTGSTSVNITSPGATQTTGDGWDLKITGNSFFIVNNGAQNLFTKAGAFTIDGAGNLVTKSTGYMVMGWQVDPTTGDIRKDTVSGLRIMKEENLTSPPEATTEATCSGIMDKFDKQLNTENGHMMSLNFYDALGYSYTAKFAVKTANQDTLTYTVELTDILDADNHSILQDYLAQGGNNTLTNIFGEANDVTRSYKLATGFRYDGTGYQNGFTDADGRRLQYDEANKKYIATDGSQKEYSVSAMFGISDAQAQNFMTEPGAAIAADGTYSYTERVTGYSLDYKEGEPNAGAFEWVGQEGADSVLLKLSALGDQFRNINVDFSTSKSADNGGICTLGTDKGAANGIDGTGRRLGDLIGIQVQENGEIYGSYDNNDVVLLGQIAVAVFANPAGLEKLGENCYQVTLNSGEFDGIGQDITADGGKMTSGVLEMSNVDLSTEFTEMITTQRGFQANSRIITTSDSLLEELVNLKR